MFCISHGCDCHNVAERVAKVSRDGGLGAIAAMLFSQSRKRKHADRSAGSGRRPRKRVKTERNVIGSGDQEKVGAIWKDSCTEGSFLVQAKSSPNNLNEFEAHWHANLSCLDVYEPDLFLDPRRTVLKCGSKPGTFRYRGIGVRVENCVDLSRIYDVYYKSTLRCTEKRRAEFEHVSTTVSQFLRWVVSTSASSREDLWKDEALFKSVANRALVESFVELFITRSSPGTVRAKALALKRVCDIGFVIVGNEITRCRLKLVSVVLQNIARAARRSYRAACQSRKSMDKRSISMKLLSTAQSNVNHLRRKAVSALDFLMRSISHETNHGFASRSIVIASLENWYRNFIGLLMLSSGGQRPQVFSQLQVPTKEEFRSLNRLSEHLSFIELRTLDEKRPRHVDLPYLVLPVLILPYLRFHSDVIRPTIQHTVGNRDAGPFRPLLLHTTTALGLKPQQITTVLRSFMSFQDCRLRLVTSMDLRRHYATMMLRSYRQREVFPGLDEEQFLKKLAQQMNTSPEQLKRTYIAHVDLRITDETAALAKFWGRFLTT